MSKKSSLRIGSASDSAENDSTIAKKTREKLEAALIRINAGTTKKIKVGSKPSVLAIAKEAQIDRSTIYRYHQDFLVKLRTVSRTATKGVAESQKNELSKMNEKFHECRHMLEETQFKLERVARNNYSLSHRVQELEDLLRVREELISNLQKKLSKFTGLA